MCFRCHLKRIDRFASTLLFDAFSTVHTKTFGNDRIERCDLRLALKSVFIFRRKNTLVVFSLGKTCIPLQLPSPKRILNVDLFCLPKCTESCFLHRFSKIITCFILCRGGVTGKL